MQLSTREPCAPRWRARGRRSSSIAAYYCTVTTGPATRSGANGTLVCVLDWEDAVVGDPLADVANARMELTMAFGAAAASDFTRHYEELAPSVDLAALPSWDLYAALPHAGRMGEWQLSPEDLERLRSGHREFTGAVLAQFPRRGRSARMA